MLSQAFYPTLLTTALIDLAPALAVIRNVFMHRRALLRNQIDFCNAPRKARLFGTIKYMSLFIHQSDLL